MQRTRTGKFRSQPKDPTTGRRISITADTPSAVAARCARVAEIRLDLKLGGDPVEAARRLRPAAGRILTLGDAWRRYLATLPDRRRLKAEEHWKRYLAILGEATYVWQLDRERLARWMVELDRAGAHAVSTRALAYDYLSSAIGLLVPEEIAILPWGKWRPPRPSRDAWEGVAAARSLEELERLLRAAREHDEASQSWSYTAIAILVCVSTGMRSAELAGLGWDCLELESDPPLVHVRYQAPRDWRRWCEDRPKLPRKGGKSVTIRLPPIAVRALVGHRAELWRRGYYRHDGPVFPGVAGRWRTSGAVIKSSLLRRFARTARIPDWRIWRAHSLRHTLGTLGFRATGDLRAIQAILGHADLKTSERYSHATGRGLPAPPVPEITLELPPSLHVAPELLLPAPEEPPPVAPFGGGEDPKSGELLTFRELAEAWVAQPKHRGPRPSPVTRAAEHAYGRAYDQATRQGQTREAARRAGRLARSRVLGAWGCALSKAGGALAAPGGTAGSATKEPAPASV